MNLVITSPPHLSAGRRSDSDDRQLEHCVRAACILEAAARKPGNVHPQAAFADLCFDDFVHSADVIAPILARTGELGVGAAVLEAVAAIRQCVGKNTNLGIVLLMAPLAAVPDGTPLVDGIAPVLRGLTVHDAQLVYRAIRTANPGGLGTAPQADVSTEPAISLLEAMRLAADRDSVAAQYAANFRLVLQFGVPKLATAPDFRQNWEQAIVRLHLELLAECPDTLIARKCGRATAEQASAAARDVLAAGWPESAAGQRRIAEFDRWLRADGNRRNPGTTADLVAASLLAAFRERIIPLPDDSLVRLARALRRRAAGMPTTECTS